MAAPEQVSFVFIDEARTPWKVETHAGSVWLFVWHDDAQRWVMVREIDREADAWMWDRPERMSRETQALYDDLDRKHS